MCSPPQPAADIERIADMFIDNNVRKRRVVGEGQVQEDLGESILRRNPDKACNSFEEQVVTGAFTWTRRTRECAEAGRGSISRQLVHSSSSSSCDETLPPHSKPATPAAANDAPPTTPSGALPVFDALPAELVSAVAASLCTAAGLVAMGRTCRAWRLAWCQPSCAPARSRA